MLDTDHILHCEGGYCLGIAVTILLPLAAAVKGLMNSMGARAGTLAPTQATEAANLRSSHQVLSASSSLVSPEVEVLDLPEEVAVTRVLYRACH